MPAIPVRRPISRVRDITARLAPCYVHDGIGSVDLMRVNSKFCDGGNVLSMAFEIQVERGSYVINAA